MMPVMDGLEMLRRIRLDHEYDSIPVIMMTTSPYENAPPDGTSYQAVLKKPFGPQELISTLNRLLPPKDRGILSEHL